MVGLGCMFGPKSQLLRERTILTRPQRSTGGQTWYRTLGTVVTWQIRPFINISFSPPTLILRAVGLLGLRSVLIIYLKNQIRRPRRTTSPGEHLTHQAICWDPWHSCRYLGWLPVIGCGAQPRPNETATRWRQGQEGCEQGRQVIGAHHLAQVRPGMRRSAKMHRIRMNTHMFVLCGACAAG